MGTWGPGNFDDDSAMEYIGELAARLFREIASAMADPREVEPDEPEGIWVPCRIETLCHLYERVPFGLPQPRVVARWKKTYLDVWDGYIDQLGPEPGYKEKRRAVIVETFDRLLAFSGRHHGDSEAVSEHPGLFD